LLRWLALLSLGCLGTVGCLPIAEKVAHTIVLPEQHQIEVRTPESLPHVPLPDLIPPRTVSEKDRKVSERRLSLDEAIRIALENTRVVRILTGLTATSSGRTIYDTAITNTTIDQNQALFDPIVDHRSLWTRTEQPNAILNFRSPNLAVISGNRIDDYRAFSSISQTNVLGGRLEFSWTENPTYLTQPGLLPLDPFNRRNTELTYTQPLLQGGGLIPNLAPVILARLDTERSFFQYKDSVQDLVRGVIEAYWNLVLSRVDLWARQIQFEQAEEALKVAESRLKVGLGAKGAEAQARVTYNQFKANLIAAQADVLAREGALRNLLMLPPEDNCQLVPVSAPTSERYARDWGALVRLLEKYRPDIVELKLILEADKIRLLLAENQALPRLDVTGLYRWNGLTGTAPTRARISSGPGEYTDWALGINFSVPLGLREGRARVRQQSLLIARDRANLEQALHAAVHNLAVVVRELDSAYEQYLAQKETRAAALENLRVQIGLFRTGQPNVIFLNVLQALNDWGNAVNFEARALIAYNIALANVERQTGTILESHGLFFHEERHQAAGPLGIFGKGCEYPIAQPPGGQSTLYPPTKEPGENAFDLQRPDLRSGIKEEERLPPPEEEKNPK
jgi:outer membrane protein TolC